MSTQGLTNQTLSQHSDDMHTTCIQLIHCTTHSSTTSPCCSTYQIHTRPLSTMGSFVPDSAPIWEHFPEIVYVGSPPSVPAHACGEPPTGILPSPMHCPPHLASHSTCCHIVCPMIMWPANLHVQSSCPILTLVFPQSELLLGSGSLQQSLTRSNSERC